MKKVLSVNHEGWNRNTDLGCNVKTILRSGKHMEAGKEYRGLLRLDSEAVVDEFLCRDSHYTFIETLPTAVGKRNPRLFEGQFITITRKDNGELRPNFKHVEMGKEFSIDGYAIVVCNELRQALHGLVEK